MKPKFFILLAASFFLSISAKSFKIKEEVAEPVNNDWWKSTIFYQIYPRSFKDSDGGKLAIFISPTHMKSFPFKIKKISEKY
jgi:hypothetical protein